MHVGHDRSYGQWWIWTKRSITILRAPWNRPLFSERNGYLPTLKLGFGWRITRRKKP